MARAALGLHPGFGPARAVGLARALRDNAFELQVTCGFQDGIAWLGEMLDILDLTMMRSLAREQRGEALFPVGQSERPQILAVFEQQVEDEVEEILRPAFRECRLQ